MNILLLELKRLAPFARMLKHDRTGSLVTLKTHGATSMGV
jgi:hypothetical protein